MSTMTTGIVKWFDVSKGIGFIIQKQGPDVFVRSKNVINSTNSFNMLGKGQHVKFILGRGPNGYQAEEVTLHLTVKQAADIRDNLSQTKTAS